MELKGINARPQDDVPTEKILQYIVKDYRRMYIENMMLKAHVSRLERIYDQTKERLFAISTAGDGNHLYGTRRKIAAALQELLYNTTKQHLQATNALDRSKEIIEQKNN